MAIPKKVINFLDKSRAKYETVQHRTVYTAYDKSATLGVPQKIIGKTLVMKADKELVMALLPANKNLDKNKFKKLTGAKKIDFVSETVIKNRLKGIKIGAVPPIGSLWKMPVFADKLLLKNPKILINSGDYNWSIKISPTVLKKLLSDSVTLGNFSQTRK